MPVETRSSDDLVVEAAATVIGSTPMPSSSIRNGYSLVPCAEPRYLTIAQPARRDLIVDAVIEQDHAVGDVLLEAVAGELAARRARR